MSTFLNLALFVGVFYLILMYAAWLDRRKHNTTAPSTTRDGEKRIA